MQNREDERRRQAVLDVLKKGIKSDVYNRQQENMKRKQARFEELKKEEATEKNKGSSTHY